MFLHSLHLNFTKFSFVFVAIFVCEVRTATNMSVPHQFFIKIYNYCQPEPQALPRNKISFFNKLPSEFGAGAPYLFSFPEPLCGIGPQTSSLIYTSIFNTHISQRIRLYIEHIFLKKTQFPLSVVRAQAPRSEPNARPLTVIRDSSPSFLSDGQ